MAKAFQNTPKLDDHSTYESWEKSIKLWRLATELPKAKQGIAVVLNLSGKDKEKVLELDTDDISGDNGLDLVIAELDKIYKKDSIDTAYEAFEKFVSFRRNGSMNIREYINEFEKLYSRAKSHGFKLADSCLGYFLLNQAKLSEDHKKLVRATITSLEVSEVKTKLQKVFGSGEAASEVEGINVKVEDVNISERDVLYGNVYGKQRWNKWRGSRGGANNWQGRYPQQSPPRGSSNAGPGVRKKTYGQGEKKKLRCNICESINHLSYNCPDRNVYTAEEVPFDVGYDIVLYQSNLITEDDFKTFVVQSATSAILDSGASVNVAGKVWFNSYISGLSSKDAEKVKYFDSSSTFKFGSGKVFKSLYRAEIPASIGSEKIMISTDVVETTVPLLLSKEAMKKADTNIDFATDTVEMFGKPQNVIQTESGHYAIPLNNSENILNKIEKGQGVRVNLITEANENNKRMAEKLHAQFGHPPMKRLKKVVIRAGLGNEKELLKEIKQVSKSCRLCRDFAKPSPTPVVGMPHADRFNETVALDLKFFEGNIILHAIDHLTRYSAAVVCKDKNPDTILKGIVQCWIAVFGPPEKFMVDNGGEFANEEFIEMADAMNMRVVATPAYSPWSNGLVERHNATLAETLHKVYAEGGDIKSSLCWALQAKNSLANVHGFTPAQLVFGQNPNVPTVQNSGPPALETEHSSQVVRDNLLKLKVAREAFIQAEHSERIKRALRHNIRPSGGNKFLNGDLVFYKRNDSRRWKGPGRVIGSESSNILIKHGSQYVRVHACRVMLEEEREVAPVQEVRTKEQTKGRNLNRVQNKEDDSQEESSQEEEDSQEEEEDSQEEEEDPQEEEEDSQEEKEDSQEEEEQAQNAAGPTQPIGKQNMGVPSAAKLKVGTVIDYRRTDDDWEVGQVISRAGKARGKYSECWNIKNLTTGNNEVLDLQRQVDDWALHITDEEDFVASHEEQNVHDRTNSEASHEVMVINVEICEEKKQRLQLAKQAEIEKWREENVFQEVEEVGQEKISTTWVVTEKLKDGKTVIKARLVARGYEEDKNDIRADSPTCMKDSVRMMLGITAGKGWKIRSLDVKAAFLQGKMIEREVFLHPPPEFRKKGKIWKLLKVVYGLYDASRAWYLKVVEVLTELGMTVGRLDKAMFTFKTAETLEGIILVHVDDLIYAGTEEFLLQVMDPFKKKLRISREESEAFLYLGVKLCQNRHGIEISQNEYLVGIKQNLIPREAMKNKDRLVDKEEISVFRKGIGQLGWLSSVTRPEAAFAYCTLSVIQAKPQVKDFRLFGKTVKELQSRQWKILIPEINLDRVTVSVFSDASHGNLHGGASQIGYIVFLHDDNGNCAPLTWVSKKARRVARSTLAAETLSAADAADNAVFLKENVEGILNKKLPPVKVYVDNKSLYDAVNSTSVVSERRLIIELGALREMEEEKKIKVIWIPTTEQLADCLTKAGANKQHLIDVLCQGKLCLDRLEGH